MAFIRVKNIRKKSGNVYRYAYLVENRWRKRLNQADKSRQKVKQYLGRVYGYKITKEISFREYHHIADIEEYIIENTKMKIIEDLVEWELARHDVGDIEVAVSKAYVKKDGNDVSIEMNEGLLNNYTLKRLISFRSKALDEREKGYELAKCFVEAGIEVPHEVFVGFFSKI